MYIKQLHIERFRNFAGTGLQFSPGINLIVGQNGQGKTNLLEAAVFLGSTKSFRTPRSAEAIGWGYESCSISGEVNDRAGPFSLGLVISPKGKQGFVHDKRVESPQDYLGRLLTITFCPQDTELVRGGPAERRALLDRHLVDQNPSLMVSLVNYGRALRAKMSLIKRGETNYRVIEPWNQVLAREMFPIFKARARFTRELTPRAASLYERFTSSPGEFFSGEYRSPVEGYSSEGEVLEALARDFSREVSTGLLRLGIHRDDLVLTLSGRGAREFSSQGQARSIVLALKLAILELIEAHRGESPIILLDDVDAELDAHRSDYFFKLMIEQERQVIVTSTDAYHGVLKTESSVQVCEVRGGVIVPL